ncbi:DUF1554 domain-containing protein [Leptospira biflexa]|uniref:DUF1554 domain-containing protein n=1 Tax=Leptospira biflexa TaxID=172 RepID=UPI0010847E02|nr:DUF1554 domain-containing protein [Leptospira biflexa]TGM34007.1 DUF1554 domain-containing protein [Leptospira biflexa]TGM39500.1 DUF1554 domain-containing protein [Leptospira biflexa]TGM41763.1 DUF1554 domain-containing protein [Leptospira biflexa]TGM51925.1 DUF1554 domain-containing protein [Leptospira biflexa]
MSNQLKLFLEGNHSVLYKKQIFQIILFSILSIFSNCEKIDLVNPCDPNSESYIQSWALKITIGDTSLHCLPGNSSQLTIGGKVAGLTGNGLKINLNGIVEISIPAGSSDFSFPLKVQTGFNYEINFKSQAQGNICLLENASGTIGLNSVTDILINCYPECTNCLIFVTQNSYPANVGKLSNFDTFCKLDPNYPGTGIFKAMVVDKLTRIASISDNSGDGQIDWVMRPNQTYYRNISTVIGTTNANGLLTTMTQTPTTSATVHWTGLSVFWTTQTDPPCGNWSSNNVSMFGTTGNGFTLAPTSFISNSFQSCSLTGRLTCVQQ